jgi:hypothetical protein
VNKKDFERACLERFLKAKALEPEGVQEGEQPDFRLCFGGKVVGVEVTRHLSGDSSNTPQAQASLRRSVMRDAEKRYNSSGAEPLHVSVYFLDHTPLQPKRVKGLAAEIAKYLVLEAQGLPMYAYHSIEPQDFTFEMGEVGLLRYARVPASDFSNWSATGVAWVRELVDDDIAAVLGRKETRLPTYKSSVPEVWLLIVIGEFDAGAIIEVSSSSPTVYAVTNFDRVFTLNWTYGVVDEIEVRPPLD